MTDSMKFGPEWLRNMSNDMSNSGSSTSSLNNNNNSISSSSSNNNNSTTAPIGPRYQLAEHRYGREEMLSLFDKNMKLPEILPTFKKLFVEKIQSPLALTPTTEDEITTNSTRSWALRNPVGTLPSRGRGAIADRGRGRLARGTYHTPLGFQRSTVLYDEDVRGMTKGDRGWPERNGSNEVGGTADWNGSPSSSPRKEYNSHSRSSIENWRRNRTEDDTGDGWRGTSNSNSGNTYRWSRSTSWREEDSTVSSGSGGVGGSGDSSSSLNRPFNSSSTVGNSQDRGGSSIGSNGSGSVNSNINSSSSFKSSNSSHINQNNGPLLSTKQADSSNNSQWDQDDMLPEWAMENPTDGGGSFDASGAFHAPNEDCEESKPSENNEDINQINALINKESKEKNAEDETENSVPSNCKQNDKSNIVESTKTIANLENKEIKSEENAFNEESKSQKIHSNKANENVTLEIKEITKTVRTADIKSTSKISATTIGQSNNMQPNPGVPSGINTNKLFTTTEIPDRMQEVDDMVEKLIMDDESVTSSVPVRKQSMSTSNTSLLKSTSSAKSNSPTLFMQQQPPQQQQSVTPMMTPESELWYYRDPQNKVQGPFTSNEMVEWYRAGYFDENLLVRRLVDERYATLGELIKICGNNTPFLSSHIIPPLTAEVPVTSQVPSHVAQSIQSPSQPVAMNVSKQNVNPILGSNDMMSLEMQLQMLQKQFLLRQQSMILNKLAGTEPWQMLTPEQQQEVLYQHLQQVVLPDHLSSLSALNNSMMVNPSSYILQQFFANLNKNDVNSVTKTNPPLHTPLPSFVGEFGNQSSLQNLMKNKVHNPIHGMQQNALSHHGNTSMENDPITSLLIQLQMANTGGGSSTSVASSVATPNPDLSNKWSPSVIQPQTWANGSANTTNVPASIWDFVSMPQSKPEMKTEQQILEEQLQQQNEKLARQSVDLMKAINVDRSELSDLNEPHQQQIFQQQQPQPQSQSQSQCLPPLQLQTQSQQQQKQPQHSLNKKSEKSKPIPDEKYQRVQKNDEESNKKLNKGGKVDKKEVKKGNQVEEERKKDSVEDKKKQKEEKKRQQIEEEKRREKQLQDEENLRQTLQERKRLEEIEQHRRSKMLENVIPKPKQANYASSIAPWSNTSLPGISTPGPNFAEIQKAEMERRAEEQRLEQILEHQKKNQLMEMMIQKENALKWNAQSLKSLNVKSLAEIQAEEHKRQLANEQANVTSATTEQARRKENEMSTGQLIGASSSTFGSIWNTRPLQNIAWNGKPAWTATSSAGFWEEPTKIMANNASKQQSLTTNTRALSKSQTVSNMQSVNKSNPNVNNNNNGSGNNCNNKDATNINNSNNNNNIISKQVNHVNNVYKQQNSGKAVKNSTGSGNQSSKSNTSSSSNNASKKDDAHNEFTSWCIKTLSTMNSGVDVPTFIGFLQDIESPYEVKDYIRMYLGETKECTEFAKQFLERRSKYKNQQRAQNAHIDDMCSPAPAINPSSNDFQEVKGKSKKIKKSKMTKLDTRILGFSVTAAQDRLNVGDRDYGDTS